MKTHLIIHTLAAAFGCAVATADEVKKEFVKTETKASGNNAEARAEAKVFGKTVFSTLVNGKPVTIIEEPDKDGKMRRKMITFENGKPKEKDVTPKEKKPSPTPVPFWKPKANAEPQKDGGANQ